MSLQNLSGILQQNYLLSHFVRHCHSLFLSNAQTDSGAHPASILVPVVPFLGAKRPKPAADHLLLFCAESWMSGGIRLLQQYAFVPSAGTSLPFTNICIYWRSRRNWHLFTTGRPNCWKSMLLSIASSPIAVIRQECWRMTWLTSTACGTKHFKGKWRPHFVGVYGTSWIQLHTSGDDISVCVTRAWRVTLRVL